MKSLDMTNEQLKISFPKRSLIKNTSSSSQINIHSSNKILMLSNSGKNTEMFLKQAKKPSDDSLKSFSIQKLGLNKSEKYSSKKIPKEGPLKKLKASKNISQLSNAMKAMNVKMHKRIPSSSQHKYENDLLFQGEWFWCFGKI